ASARRHLARHRTAPGPHAAELGILRLRGRCRGPVRGSFGMKRFYKKAKPVPSAGGHGIALDGRLVKTSGKHDLIVPSLALAASVAAEWDAQQGEIRREAMPLTRL